MTTSTSTSPTQTPTKQTFHHLIAVNIRTRILYTPSLLNDDKYRATCSAIRRNLTQLALELNPAWEIQTFMPLGPVLDGVHQSPQRTWIRLKIELLISSRHRTSTEVLSCLREVLYRKLDLSCIDRSQLPVTGFTLHARSIKSITGADSNEAIARIMAAEDLQHSLSSCRLAGSLPAKREIGVLELIRAPLSLSMR